MKKAIAALILILSAQIASAQQACAPHDVWVEHLAQKYGESRQSVGLAQTMIVEVFSSDVGSWTILATKPNMVSCLIASGQAFETVAEVILPGDEM